MSDTPSREECAAQFDVFSNPIYVRAAAYLRQDADLAARLAKAEAERDALAEQVASCRKAFGEIAKSIEDLDLEEVARFAGVPLEHLTGETEEVGE